MNVIKTSLPGVLVIEPKIFSDERGFFLETFKCDRYKKLAGIDMEFVQDNYSRSAKGVLRGLHFQKTKPQGKLARVVMGEVFDVAVDINPSSLTYGQYASTILTAQNKRQFWVPPGYAHGFAVLSEFADFEYKCTDYYDPNDEGCLNWSDPDIAIEWPLDNPLLSLKDSIAPSLKQLSEQGG